MNPVWWLVLRILFFPWRFASNRMDDIPYNIFQIHANLQKIKIKIKTSPLVSKLVHSIFFCFLTYLCLKKSMHLYLSQGIGVSIRKFWSVDYLTDHHLETRAHASCSLWSLKLWMDRTALRNGRWRDLSLTLERRELTPFEKFKFFREAWPLDGIQLAALEEHAKGNAHEIVIDYGHLHLLPPPAHLQNLLIFFRLWELFLFLCCSDFGVSDSGAEESSPEREVALYPSDMEEAEEEAEEQEEEEEDGGGGAGLGGGWGRIVFPPVRRGRHVAMDVCRACSLDGSEGAFERVVVTRSKNPTLHRQARKSLWGDLWPF